jgi:hypothetical protein
MSYKIELTDNFKNEAKKLIKKYPPRSIPPSFSPVTIMEETLNEIKLQKNNTTRRASFKEKIKISLVKKSLSYPITQAF